MREISLDTETTGLSADQGDRIVEIGCVELDNLMPTGRTFHVYMDPQRAMSEGASQITGITDDMLRGKPLFRDIAQDFREFIADDILVIHNAAFDIKFINAEFARLGAPPLQMNRVVDTLAIARKRFPGAQATLDALCRRFGVDNSAREKHGALLDAEILAEVYLELKGGRQPGFMLSGDKAAASASPTEAATVTTDKPARRRSSAPPVRLSDEERTAHEAFIAELGDAALWRAAEAGST